VNGAARDSDVRSLRAQLDGTLLDPADVGYDSARRVFNRLFDRRPALIARCRNAGDVAHCIRFAREHGLLLSVRGGGHSIAGYSVCDGGLVIDLSPMRSVEVDAISHRARVGGGALWADVDRETQRYGLATPGGVVSHTGVAGLTLGGGIGWLRNAYGLSCDNLRSADVVTADGRRMTASRSENEDLFWALRGGGGNFGVVTAFEFALHPVGPAVAALFPIYPMRKARSVLQQWCDWVIETPREISSEVVLWTAPELPAFPPEVRAQPVVIPGAVCAGPADRGLALLEPMRRFGDPLAVIGGVVPYCGVQTAFDASFPTGELCSYWKSLYVERITEPMLEALAAAAEERTSPQTMIVLQHFGGAVREVSANHTAFAMRDAPFLINIMGTWIDPQDSARHVAWVREVWHELSALGTSAMYLNYMGEEPADGEALVRRSLGANYARLARIKHRYDPDNLFRLNPNVR
jgi:FAD/FMN-containing dehydrogenase